MNLSNNIKILRKSNNLSLEELALKVGTTKQNMLRYETGVIENIPFDRIEAIAKVFNISPATLVYGDVNDEDILELIGQLKDEDKDIVIGLCRSIIDHY